MAEPDTTPTILVVEDDELIAPLLTFILEREGYRALLAQDGQAALRIIKESPPPALALLDMMLPYVDGLQLVKLIRETPGWEKVPIVMVSARSQERDIVRVLDAGANDYIVKPFQPLELSARLKRILRDGK